MPKPPLSAWRALSSVSQTAARRRNRAHRRSALPRLAQVGRVHAPEADMRPVLPYRDLLLKSVASPPPPPHSDAPTRSTRTRTRPAPVAKAYTARLAAQAARHARYADRDRLAAVLRDTVNAPPTVDPDVCLRAVAVSAVQAVAARDAALLDAVMACLTEEEALHRLRSNDVGMVLDVLVRGMLARGENAAAFRGELLSRLLETRLRRGTYSLLIERCDSLELALGLLHRAVAVGVEPNRPMLHAVLRQCFAAGDGVRARGVLSDMAVRGVRVNADTLDILLAQAPCVDSVAAVLRLVQGESSRVRLSAHVGSQFVQAFLRVGGRDEGVMRAFDTLDWFYRRGVGVSRAGLHALVMICAREGRVDAALRAWRELRRAWFGKPDGTAAGALWGALAAHRTLRARLESEFSEAEIARWRRNALRWVDDTEADKLALGGDEPREQAAVLHRWCAAGKLEDAIEWIDRRVADADGRGVDVRLVLAVLSYEQVGRRGKALDFCLGHLAAGDSVAGDRAYVIDRAVDTVWRWLVRRADGDGEAQVQGDEPVNRVFERTVDKKGLRATLERVVRVIPPVERGDLGQ